MKKFKRTIALAAAGVLLAGVLSGCGARVKQDFQTMEDFAQAKIGVMTGSYHDLLSDEYFPEAEKVRFMNMTDLVLNLKQGKIDGILMDKAFYTPLKWEEEELACLQMDMPLTEYAVAFPPEGSEELKGQVDAFIRDHTESGWISENEAKWFSAVEPESVPDPSRLTGENGSLRVAVSAESRPIAYLQNGQHTGFDADLLFCFAEEYGYDLQVDVMDFGAMLPSLAAGRYDLAISSITVTEERAESVLFSEVYHRSPAVMAVLKENTSVTEVRTMEELATSRMGVMTGSSHDGTVREFFPDADRVYFNTVADMVLAVEQGKIDCYIEDEPFLTSVVWEGAGVQAIEGTVKQVRNGFIVPQNQESQPLREELNEFIAAARADGTVDRLKEKWLGSTEPTEHPDYTTLTGENGTIRLAVVVDSKPMLYQYNNMFTGFEIELLTLFAQQYGYDYEFESVTFDSVIAGIAVEKYDLAASSLNITPEREESVDFTDAYGEFDVLLVTKAEDTAVEQYITSLDQLENGVIGVLTGSFYDGVVDELFPNAEKKYFNTHADMIVGMEQGKIDALFEDKTICATMCWENAPVIALDETIAVNQTGMIFPKEGYDQQVLDQLNAFIAKSVQDGSVTALQNKWLGATEPTEHPDYRSLSGENGTLKIAVGSALKPASYLKGNDYTGYEVEFLTNFAREYGYALDFEGMSFDALIPSVASGKCDLGAGCISITPERAQSVTFSDSHISTDGVAIVYRGVPQVHETGFFDDVAESFEKTFIRENRWQLILKGVGVTLLISICSAAAGTLLGFGLYMLSRSDVKLLRSAAKGVAKVYSRIVEGTPVVVILMILFYVIFGSIRDISGVLVAIIGFSLTFGAFVYDHMTVSVNSVDWGQTEAAYALGYTKNLTFFRILLPQAMKIFLPSYCGQAVELIKATAVVGYIAVNDLTKMGDIIRSNTYEAFFPLIATAVIYFLLTWALSLVLGLVKNHFEPKRRSDEEVLKGVKTE